MNSQPVVIKSSKNGINLVLDSKLPFDELLEEIKKKFIDSEKFFKDAHIAISFEGRALSQAEQFEIIEMIQQYTSITIICILDHDELMDEVMKRRIGAYQEEHSPQTGQFYKGTLRSGQQIESQTSLIVLGDVNPGAKVIAKGNIVVLGALKEIPAALWQLWRWIRYRSRLETISVVPPIKRSRQKAFAVRQKSNQPCHRLLPSTSSRF